MCPMGLYQDRKLTVGTAQRAGTMDSTGYIDNLLIMADSPEKARDHTLALLFLLENLGVQFNSKSQQRFLHSHWNS